ncbi:hypothetical protein DXG03_001014 [Asterophora parasitica]|uniref:Uncharacterized protein n=1 Tax=Asterophora parasitica TaxID=117018 RepID=A0A9P7KD13_9AGAR|nr:hypothetical protein DXG03_001014 [Asterophora parasitica]
MLPRKLLPRRALPRVGCATPRHFRAAGLLPQRSIRTLNQDLLEPLDFVDLSDKRQPILYVQSDAAGPLNYVKNVHVHVPFPSNARGFLYLHRPPSLSPLAAQIRLRLTPEPNPNLFSTGADLLRGTGPIPWSINLPQILTAEKYAPFKAQIASDGLIDASLLDSLKLAWKSWTKSSPDTQTIFTLTQPFEMNLADTSTSIRILTAHAQGRIILQHLFQDGRDFSDKHPYRGALPHPVASCEPSNQQPAGRILAHFEISPLPKHARPASCLPILVLRVLKILTPIEYAPGYDMHLPMPLEGGLLSKKLRGRSVTSPPVPIIFNVEKMKDSKQLKDLGLLIQSGHRRRDSSLHALSLLGGTQ